MEARTLQGNNAWKREFRSKQSPGHCLSEELQRACANKAEGWAPVACEDSLIYGLRMCTFSTLAAQPAEY